MEPATAFVTDPKSLGTFVLFVLALIGFMDVCEIFLRKFVTWTHKLRLLWRKFWSEPDPRLLNE